MRGNSLVRFLGGGGAVMRCCYPTFNLHTSRRRCVGSVNSPQSLTYVSFWG
ncbi:hypothetical protein AHZ37_000289 [Salmonella enterica subsp. indica]|nr:hypothetical protein [Salmonella enterica subsp. enterica]EDR2770292.1 hypothetical protein [Salmonella enterica subsp. enterica serovar Oslo]EDT9218030.1 hypothetical protein [Salmonella enterica subsp. indica]EEJ0016643.1 hypothetical protein [Salmonella enterica subsp. enterica]HAE2755309.1 hypothetical protein [Salmonella enterica subsp. indica]